MLLFYVWEMEPNIHEVFHNLFVICLKGRLGVLIFRGVGWAELYLLLKADVQEDFLSHCVQSLGNWRGFGRE